MTEQEWMQATDPRPMLEFLQGKTSDRKLRLFAIACCRRHYHRRHYHVLSERGEKAVEVFERFADGHASEAEFQTAYSGFFGPPLARPGSVTEPPGLTVAAVYNLLKVAWTDPSGSAMKLSGWFHHRDHPYAEAQAPQAEYLRDLIGPLPFRPVSIDPVWLSWHDGCVGTMARTIYEERRFEEIPILADALEEAGCQDQDILVHCRRPGEHVRGCWVVDLVLGKS
jgi:hypothetical protein